MRLQRYGGLLGNGLHEVALAHVMNFKSRFEPLGYSVSMMHVNFPGGNVVGIAVAIEVMYSH